MKGRDCFFEKAAHSRAIRVQSRFGRGDTEWETL